MLVRMRRRDVGSDATSGETARRQRARGAGAASRQAARRQPPARRVPAPLAAARLRVRQLRRRQRARPAVTQLCNTRTAHTTYSPGTSSSTPCRILVKFRVNKRYIYKQEPTSNQRKSDNIISLISIFILI